MKKILLKTLILGSVWILPAAAQQFVDCSEGNFIDFMMKRQIFGQLNR